MIDGIIGVIKLLFGLFSIIFIFSYLYHLILMKYRKVVVLKKLKVKKSKISFLTSEVIDLIQSSRQFHSLVFTKNGVYVTKYERE